MDTKAIRYRNLSYTILAIFLAIFFLGALALPRLSISYFPQTSGFRTIILTRFADAPPDQVDRKVSLPISRAISTLKLKNIESLSSFGISAIKCEVLRGEDIDVAILHIREKLDAIKTTLPKQVSRPIILKFDPSARPLLNIAITFSNNVSKKDRYLHVKQLREGLQRLNKAVASVKVYGVSEEAVYIDLLPQQLELYQLSLNEIIATIGNNNASFSGGMHKTEGYNYIVRIDDEIGLTNEMEPDKKSNSLQELRDLLIPRKRKSSIPLGQLARIYKQYPPLNTYASFYQKDFQPSDDTVLLEIQRRPDCDIDEASTIVREYLDNHPAGDMHYTILADSGEEVKNFIQDVGNVALAAGLLVFFIVLISRLGGRFFSQCGIVILCVGIFLYFFKHGAFTIPHLNPLVYLLALVTLVGLTIGMLNLVPKVLKSAIIIFLALPMSLSITFLLMYALGRGLNWFSMAGIVISIGLLIDNAIVVMNEIDGVVKPSGNDKVFEVSVKDAMVNIASPLFSSSLTTMVVVLPVCLISSPSAHYFLELALVVTLSLLGSLLFSLFLIPALIIIFKPETTSSKISSPILPKLQSSLASFSERINLSLGSFVTKLKPVFTASSLFILCGGFLCLLYLFSAPWELFPHDEEVSQMELKIRFPDGTTVEQISRVMKQVEKEIRKIDDLEHSLVKIGHEGETAILKAEQVNIYLKWQVNKSPLQIEKVITDALEKYYDPSIASGIPEVTLVGQINIAESFLSLEAPFILKIFDLDSSNTKKRERELQNLVSKLSREVKKIEGVFQVRSSWGDGVLEKQLTIFEEQLKTHNLNARQVANNIKIALVGKKVSELQHNGRFQKIFVRYTPKAKKHLEDLAISREQGKFVPLKKFAAQHWHKTQEKVMRHEQKKVSLLFTEVQRKKNLRIYRDKLTVVAQTFNNKEKDKGFRVVVTGEDEVLQNILWEYFVDNGLVIIVLIYLILLFQFNNFGYPAIVIVAGLFSFALGIGIALWLFQIAISFVVVMAVVFILGIAVNNSILLTSKYQEEKKAHPPEQALEKSIAVRNRSIAITSFTSIATLIPMLFSQAAQSVLAIVIICSLISGWLCSIYATPVVFKLYRKISLRMAKIFHKDS